MNTRVWTDRRFLSALVVRDILTVNGIEAHVGAGYTVLVDAADAGRAREIIQREETAGGAE